ncbi:asparaginase [Ramlibacter sp.]|uniref:asparaginase n=1 Tax=Ramlibacter sp. TaxID=1917967 RepID=UPI001836EEBE|nr:asparaginase [Ramlibacter sp.]MBA2675152.1 asparaginase [Ramlibacter sp.]
MKDKKIVVLGTGGTIAGRAQAAYDALGYRAAEVSVEDLLRDVPGLGGQAIASEQVAQVDSKDMDCATWRRLALRCARWLQQDDVAGIVVTHGTDTMEETAYFLQALLAPRKPVVLTGAMRPATSPYADGPRNLADAVCVARAASASGVVVVFSGEIHDPVDVRKVHTYRLDAFGSGEAGPIGYVEEGRIRLKRNWPAALSDGAKPPVDTMAGEAAWPRVEVVLNHAGADGAVVQALVAQGIDGIVVAATGNGSLSQGLEAALLDAQARGVKVVRCTRCAEGVVLGHAADRLPHSTQSPVKARIDLLLSLLAGR